jgi:hypothetical protein
MSPISAVPRRIILFGSGLEDRIDRFLFDRKARNLTLEAIRSYRFKLTFFNDYCASALRNKGCRHPNSA